MPLKLSWKEILSEGYDWLLERPIVEKAAVKSCSVLFVMQIFCRMPRPQKKTAKAKSCIREAFMLASREICLERIRLLKALVGLIV